jgi:hypothetical protein
LIKQRVSTADKNFKNYRNPTCTRKKFCTAGLKCVKKSFSYRKTQAEIESFINTG